MRRPARDLLLAYAAFVLVVTWWPSPASSSAPQWEQHILGWVRGVGVPMTMPVLEVVANIGMFVPLGVLLMLAVSPRRWPAPRMLTVAAAAGAGFSTIIELVQLGIPGRFSTVQDVVMNTLGAVVGAGVALGLRGLSRS
jgi:glycopeptide antibiotics resistance protein